MTTEEVCDALLEGNADTLGTVLLQSLMKMAPTKDEERKLQEHQDDSPLKIGPAEKFVKAVLDVPFAFRRVGAMLFVSNFDSEVEYLKQLFQTLEVACEELKNNMMFLKLLEVVLKSANHDGNQCQKLGLQIVSSLSSGLSNVKKAAGMDSTRGGHQDSCPRRGVTFCSQRNH